MKNIAIITARSGSKGLPDKNIKVLGGMPLLAYSIQAAQESNLFDKIFLSTDSEKYAEIGKQYGADASFLRSEEMSSDTAGSWDVVREVIREWEKRGEYYDTITLLQPTSPLRTGKHIRDAFQLLEEKGASSVVSVCEMEHSPLWCDTLPEDGCMDHFGENKNSDLPRQMLPIYYRINGAVYLLRRDELDKEPMFREKSYAYIMPGNSSIDIDEETDFWLAELLLKRKMGNKQ